MSILEDGAPAPPERQWEKCPRTGARRLGINVELLTTLAEEGMKDSEIATHLRCSRITVFRRRKQLGIQKRAWSNLSQEDLVEVSLIS
jgi:DNA-binding NtrC family response regulator